MPEYNKITPAIAEQLKAIVGDTVPDGSIDYRKELAQQSPFMKIIIA